VRKLISGTVVVMAMMVLAPRGARACGQGNGYGGLAVGLAVLYVAGFVAGLTDVGMTIADLTTVSGLSKPSATYGTVELLIAVPQLAIGIAGMTQASSSFFTGYTLWMAALTAHGIWSIASTHSADSPPDLPVPDPNPPPEPPAGAKVMFGPTYVPLGPLAQVGFGLSGRF
jgi:hypothetical protein